MTPELQKYYEDQDLDFCAYIDWVETGNQLTILETGY
jgi:hypothetical protein